MRYVRLLFLLLSVWNFWACQKSELPNPVAGEPVFWVNFQFGDETFADTAGVAETYLFTRYEKDARNLFHLLGSFAPADCPQADCPGTFTLELRTQELIDTAFSGGQYPYFQSNAIDSVRYRVTLAAEDVDTLKFLYRWWLADTQERQGPVVSFESLQASLIPIRLEISARQDSFLSVVSRLIAFGPVSNPAPRVNLSTGISGNLVEAFASVTPAGAYTYWWNTGATTPALSGQSPAASAFSVTVTNTANGYTGSAAVSGVSNWVEPIRTSNFILQGTETINVNLRDALALEWIDPAGSRWRSDWGAQDSDAFFRILDNEPFDPNENGQPTRKIAIQYRCRLFNADGLGKDLEGTGVVAVVWP